MKKFLMALPIFMLILLSSCGTKDKREVIRDYPLTSIKEDLKLDLVQNGKNLNKDLDKSKAHSNVQIAENAKDTLFYQTINLDEYMNERFKQVNLRVLYFNDQIPSTDVASFLTEMNHKDYGLSEEKIGYTFNTVENYSNVLFGKISFSYALKLPSDFEKKENDSATLVVTYLPTYCTYNDGKQDSTKVFIFVPVFYAFTYESSVEEYIKEITEFKVEVNDKGLLPSNPAQ